MLEVVVEGGAPVVDGLVDEGADEGGALAVREVGPEALLEGVDGFPGASVEAGEMGGGVHGHLGEEDEAVAVPTEGEEGPEAEVFELALLVVA
eukprot:CAMPEP_0118909348 /NCGR_PEP_ID=MMETSP1166-20130328/11967_1 /TAXON_ID=1104430 /ORGANISM="Chrysoreinhardia sp, Strain CCMP3193" /LENGTH=92 /DNA_ID=CAMNT_0006848771 /DNA_START=180 /DNA_END=454 /DNA_ORIENTATION=+